MRYVVSPSAGQVQEAIAKHAPSSCSGGNLTTRRIDSIGGPGLPEGMVRAYRIVCDLPGSGEGVDRELAAVQKFTSADAALRWVEDFDPADDASYSRWLNGSTMLTNINLTDDAWNGVLRDLGRNHEGHRVRR